MHYYAFNKSMPEPCVIVFSTLEDRDIAVYNSDGFVPITSSVARSLMIDWLVKHDYCTARYARGLSMNGLVYEYLAHSY